MAIYAVTDACSNCRTPFKVGDHGTEITEVEYMGEWMGFDQLELINIVCEKCWFDSKEENH